MCLHFLHREYNIRMGHILETLPDKNKQKSVKLLFSVNKKSDLPNESQKMGLTVKEGFQKAKALHAFVAGQWQ